MKKRIIFEPADFEGRGQIVIRQSGVESNNITLAYIIGYDPLFRGSACMISLADGQIITHENGEDLCIHLNNDPIGYVPMEYDDIGDMMKDRGNRFKTSP